MHKIAHTAEYAPFELQLDQKGFAVIPEKMIPLTSQQWSRLENLTEPDNLSYDTAEMGDTHEPISISVFRIKKTGQETIWHQDLMALLGSPAMLNLYQKICKNNRLIIDRCQAHLCKTNDFIGRHIDQESYPGYTHSLLIAISKNYLGGEIVMYRDENTDAFQIPYRSLLVTNSDIAHEVLPVKSGIRKTIAIFLTE